MERNIQKAVEEGKRIRSERPRLDLSVPEIYEIWDKHRDKGRDSFIDAIVDAYSAGLAIGMRTSKKAAPEEGQA